jgi:phosphate uptake regulator
VSVPNVATVEPLMRGDSSDPIERKVQIAGGSTFTLSLPREWGVSQNLGKGDSLYLYPERDRLVVAPSTLEEGVRAARIETVDKPEDIVQRHVKSAYIEGYNEIRVRNDGAVGDEIRRSVVRTSGSLIGMEVSEATDEIVIRDHLDAGAVSLEQSIVQIRQLALGMQSDAAESVRMNDEMLAQRVSERDDHVDRLFAFVARGLHCGLNDMNELTEFDIDGKAALYYYKIARELEQVADKAERIAGVTETQSAAPDEEFGTRFKKLVSKACTVVERALKNDSSGASNAYDDLMHRLDVVEDELARCSDPDSYWYATVIESVRRTAQLGLNIVNMTVESSVSDMLYSGTQVETDADGSN